MRAPRARRGAMGPHERPPGYPAATYLVRAG